MSTTASASSVSPREGQQAQLDLAEIREALEANYDLTSGDTELGEAVDRMTTFIAAATPEMPSGYGKKLSTPSGEKLVDRNEKRLHIGDRVQITGSSRYGDTKAMVTGVSQRTDKPAVIVSLDDGRDDSYEPSASRCERIEKAIAPKGSAEESDAA